MQSIVCIAITGLLVSGCGALFNGGPGQVNFTSEPAGAEVWIDGSRRGVTPVVLPLAKNDDYAVMFRKAGYQDVTATLTKRVSAGYVVLDVLGGLLPIIVDAATGSWYVLDTDNLHRTLSSTTQGMLSPDELRRVMEGESVGTFIDVHAGQTESPRR